MTTSSRVPLDVTSAEQWDAAVRTVVERFGALSALVNNAGVLHRAALTDETAEGFEGSWRVNCLGPFLGIRAALPHLANAEGAAIVNTCSTGAIRPFPNHAAYGSSKWALRGLTQIARRSWRRSGIRVNAVLPGPIETPMLDPDTQRRLVETSTGGRLGKPMEVADAVAFLVSEPRRSSPAPNSSSTADSRCGSDDGRWPRAPQWESSVRDPAGWRWEYS